LFEGLPAEQLEVCWICGFRFFENLSYAGLIREEVGRMNNSAPAIS
jgi:hypothetical protein